MAFQATKGRYASFGVAVSLPPELIDTFWEIIDHYLKGVFPLNTVLAFRLIKNKKTFLMSTLINKLGFGLFLTITHHLTPFTPKRSIS